MVVARKRTTRSSSGATVSGEIVVVRKDCPCGWCLTNDCAHCKGELLSDKKLYMCGCTKCCNGHIPSIGVESSTEPTTPDAEADPDDS